MAATGPSNGNEDETISGINVTPLVDVVLVLLIILMVTAQYAAEKDSIAHDQIVNTLAHIWVTSIYGTAPN